MRLVRNKKIEEPNEEEPERTQKYVRILTSESDDEIRSLSQAGEFLEN
jgi:hypothetical protein